MKFHRLTIRNLTSIAGEQTVDFDALFSIDSLLLIHGPTGAGKTTLLDAITLTLFDETARISDKEQNKRNQLELNELKLNDPRQIVTHGAESASAELVFSVILQGTRRYFRAGWFVERVATRKGNPPRWSDTRRLLVELDANGNDLPGGLKVSSSKAKEFGPAFETVLGTMDAEQFRRSVLLAQGQFAALLHADATERAKMLEGLTNTDAFGHIGERAAERFTAAKQEVERIRAEMNGASVWSDEALEENRRLRAAQEEQAKALSARLDTARLGQAWWSGLSTLEQATSLAQEASGVASAEQASLEPLRLWQERFRVTEPLILHYEAAERSDEAAAAKETKASELDAAKVLLEQQLNTVRGEASAAQAAVHAASKTSDGLLAELPAVQKLHVAVTTAKAAHETASGLEAETAIALTAASAKHSEAVAAVEGLKQRLSAAASTSAELDGWRNREEEVRALEQATADWKAQQARRVEVAERQRLRDQIAALAGAVAQEAMDRTKLAELEVSLASAAAAEQSSQERLDAATQAVADAERQRDLLRALADVEQHRHLLVPGEACALCGATDHPAAALPVSDRTRELQQASDELQRRAATRAERAAEQAAEARRRNQAEGGVANQRKTVEASERAVAAATALRDTRAAALGLPATHLEAALDAEQQAFDDALAAARLALEAACSWLPAAALRQASVDADDRLRAVRDALHRAATATAEVGKLQELLGGAQALVADNAAVVEAAAKLLATRKDATVAAAAALRAANEAVAATWGGRAPDLVLAEANAAVQTAAKHADSVQVRLRAAELTLANAVAEQEQLRRDAQECRDQAVSSNQLLTAGLLAAGRSRDSFLADLRTPAERAEIAAQIATADEKLRAAIASAAAAENALASHRQTPVPGGFVDGATAADAVHGLEAEAQSARDEMQRLAGAYEEALRNLELQKGRRAALTRAEEQLGAWKVVYDLIGGGKGDLFRKAAQALNLERLIRAANIWLRDLNPRYAFRQSFHADGSPSLDFHLVDAHYAGAPRGVNAISGGETFLCSLALALGLASERGQTLSIETLLLDEGFGTLDADSLEEAIQTLEKLKSRKTSVGIISHVEGLRSRIQSQLEVRKVAPGRSIITPVRCP